MDGHISNNTLDVYSETLLQIAEKLKSLSNTDDLKQLKELNNEIAETLPILKEIDNIGTELTKPIIDELKTNLQTLINDIQNKLDSGFFKGLKGDSFEFKDFTPEQIESLKIKGDSFKFSDFTNEQIESLKVKGDSFKFTDFTPQQIENLKIKGDEGKPFVYNMFTAQQLENLKVHGNDGKDAIRDMDDTVAISKTLDFNDGVFSTILEHSDSLPRGYYLSTITFYTSSRGGAIYNATLFFLLPYHDATNTNLVVPLVFNQLAHSFNGRTVELFLRMGGGRLLPSLYLKINGESSVGTVVNMKFKRVLL